MNIIARRIATGFVLAAAPAVIAVGAAASSQAQATDHRPAATQSHTAQHGATALIHRHRHHGYYYR